VIDGSTSVMDDEPNNDKAGDDIVPKPEPEPEPEVAPEPVPEPDASVQTNTLRYETSFGDVDAAEYTGLVDFLEYQFIGSASGETAVGSLYNDFMNMDGGDDAVDGGAGNDVLDGGQGSNFLTGGAGDDVFFLDGRDAQSTWSTITDFEDGDTLNIWGWQSGISELIGTETSQGASGFEGATLHYDLDGDSSVDTSVTFSGVDLEEVLGPQEKTVAGEGYLLFTAPSTSDDVMLQTDPSNYGIM